MKIFIINPDFGVTPEQMAARCHLLSVHVGPDVELHMECLVENHIEIDSALDAALAAPEIIKMAVRAESEGYDAVVLYCFSDPAVDACREVVSIPVVGGGQASCLLAPLVGRQAGLLLADTARYAESSFLLLNAVLILRVLLQSAALRPVVLICGQSVSVFLTCLRKPAKICWRQAECRYCFWVAYPF